MATEAARQIDHGRLIGRARSVDLAFACAGLLVMVIAMAMLMALIVDLVVDGLPRLSWDFLTSFPSRRPGRAGILSAWVGTALVMLVTAALSVPLGVAAGLYLEEYAPKNWITDLIEINVTNLAGVPSIIYGLLALGLFVYGFGLGETILVAGMVLALLTLPVVIVATREAIRSIPRRCARAPMRSAPTSGRPCACTSCRPRRPASSPAPSSGSRARSARRRR